MVAWHSPSAIFHRSTPLPNWEHANSEGFWKSFAAFVIICHHLSSFIMFDVDLFRCFAFHPPWEAILEPFGLHELDSYMAADQDAVKEIRRGTVASHKNHALWGSVNIHSSFRFMIGCLIGGGAIRNWRMRSSWHRPLVAPRSLYLDCLDSCWKAYYTMLYLEKHRKTLIASWFWMFWPRSCLVPCWALLATRLRKTMWFRSRCHQTWWAHPSTQTMGQVLGKLLASRWSCLFSIAN